MARESFGVSFVVPALNGERTLARVLDSILAQEVELATEIIVVDDGSNDRTRDILRPYADDARVCILSGSSLGAAASINAGVRAASYSLIAQIDQDVVLEPGWLEPLLSALEDPAVGAAQAGFSLPREEPILVRVNALDLDDRYRRRDRRDVEHVCTGNTIYRRSALDEVGSFDEQLGYGYDNDMSYRLRSAGWGLRYIPEAQAAHLDRRGLVAYLKRQYGLGYGRLDLIAKHPRRAGGDDASSWDMVLHAGASTVLALVLLPAILAWSYGTWFGTHALAAVATISLSLFLERALAGGRILSRQADSAALALPFVHLLRDSCWALAVLIWSLRRLLGRAQLPQHSMGR